MFFFSGNIIIAKEGCLISSKSKEVENKYFNYIYKRMKN